ncbi:MAG: Ni/Fe hydrogenase subunit alpha [Candidatus Zixiibacteriota bacterium]|nr:MAG: Ni/Fe hydrogenase subunit alpha [candidate division Zixibacteria bacterium]
MSKSSTKTIHVDYLARVEGEGSLFLKIKDNKVQDVKFKIFEPPRFFEAFLRDRHYYEAPDITARICGICPVAYQMGSVHAMEMALGIDIDKGLRELRRLIYCGEWIESHVLHVYMLHAPDFLGYQDAIQMAKDYPDVVNEGLRLKKIGNEIVALLGGREIHPVNVKVGGFYKVPTKKDLQVLLKNLKWAKEAAHNMIKLTASMEYPDFEQDYEFVALRHPDEYPFNEGRLVSNRGLDIDIADFDNHFEEEHVKHSTSLHCRLKERGAYKVGPLARYSLNFDRFTPEVQKAAKEAGLKEECYNPFKSIIVRAVETLFAVNESIRIIENYEEPKRAYIEINPKEGVGYGCTEAPRGICYHRYNLDHNGLITDANIVPPTSQNQKSIESDLTALIPTIIDLPDEDITWKCEQAIRNYDPCISCSCHFLKVKIDRE